MMRNIIQSVIKTFSKKYWFILFVTVVCLPVFFLLVRPGFYPMHDDFQVIRTFEMDKCLKDGQFPCRWVPDMGFGYGYPEFNYYAPLPYYLIELIHLTGFSILDSVKVFIVLITLISAFGMFFLARYLWKSEVGAALSTILYLYLPFRAVDIYVRGAVPELTAMAVMPFIFLFAAKVVAGKPRSVFWFGVSLAVLFLSHNIATLIITPLVGLWVLVLTVRNKNWQRFKGAAAGLLIGIGLSAFFLLPAWFEKGFVHIETLTSGYFNYLAHFVSLKQMLFSNHWGYGASQLGANDDISLSTGITHWLAALTAVVTVLIYRQGTRLTAVLFFFGVGIVSLFFMHERSSFIWTGLPVLAFIQFPWRFLGVAGFSFSLAGGALGLIPRKFVKWPMVGVIALATFVLYISFFQPKQWLDITDSQKLTGLEWTKAITASLYDYLPTSAKKGPDFEAAQEPATKTGNVKIVSGEKGTDWQKWKIDSVSENSVVELQIYYFPNWIVKVDGREVQVDYNNPNGLMDVSLSEGTHEVEARLADTKLRSTSNIISMLAVIPLAYVFIKRK